jgi:predicted CXXCH cytochrome family protein
MHPVAGAAGTVGAAATCRSCHSTHAGGAEAPKADTNVSNQLCIECHALAQPKLFSAPRQTPHNALDCTMCHSVHAAAEPRRLLNTTLDDAEFCLECHDDHEPVLGTPHHLGVFAPTAVNARGRTVETGGPCSACHNIHSDARPPVIAPPETARCTSCHAGGGPAKAPVYRAHPLVPMLSPVEEDEPGYLPLIGSNGAPGPTGAIACLTCHLPHGRASSLNGPAASDPAMIRGQRLLVRPYVAPNLCSACHGFDGLQRFLRFHDPIRNETGDVP